MSRVKYRQFYNGEFYFWGFIDGEFIAPKVIYPELVNDQFTGIHDKHGAEIYEGDILRVKYRCGHDGEYFSDCYFTVSINPLNGLVLTFKCRANNSHPIGEKYENQNSPEGTICAVYGTLSVDFENRNYDRIAIDQRESVFAYSDDIEKVGNIHEHPELLKEADYE